MTMAVASDGAPPDIARGPNAGDTRERILSAAAEILCEQGYARTTTRAVAAAAAVNEVTLFRHFGNKQRLLTAVLERYSALPAIASMLDHQLAGDYREDLTRLGHLYLAVLSERREAVQMLLWESRRSPEVREVTAEMPRQLHRMLVEYLRRQIEAGNVRALDADVAAWSFFSMFFTRVMAQTVLPELSVRAETQEALVAEFVDIFVRGTEGRFPAPQT